MSPQRRAFPKSFTRKTFEWVWEGRPLASKCSRREPTVGV